MAPHTASVRFGVAANLAAAIIALQRLQRVRPCLSLRQWTMMDTLYLGGSCRGRERDAVESDIVRRLSAGDDTVMMSAEAAGHAGRRSLDRHSAAKMLMRRGEITVKFPNQQDSRKH